jgi:hypothetical protein
MLPIGSTAPDLTLNDQNGKPFTLSDAWRDRNVVLFFYPKAGTAVCTKEACSFRDALADVQAHNAMIIGVAGCLADSFALGMGAGLSAESVQQFVTGFPFAAIVAGRGARMIKGEYDPSFELSMARKDVRLMCESAAERPLAVLPGLGQRMDALIAEGHGGKDLGALSITTIPAKK